MSRARGEWPLVAFTLLGQASVGMFLALGAARLAVRGAVDAHALGGMFGGPLLATGVLLQAALLMSMRHLARPLSAWRALRNVAGSWVSLEVVFGVGFAVVGAAFAALELFGLGSQQLRDVAGGIAAALGVGFVAAMAQIYRLPARPAWNHPATAIGFFTTTAWLGSLAAAVSLAAFARWTVGLAILFPDRLAAVDRVLGALAGFAAVAGLLDAAAALLQERVRRKASHASSLPESPAQQRRRTRLTTVRAVVTLAAAAAAGAYALRQPRWSALEGEGAGLLAGALLLAATAATIGRTIFYGERPRAGL